MQPEVTSIDHPATRNRRGARRSTLEQLCDAIAAAFDLDSLKQLGPLQARKETCNILDCGKPFRNRLRLLEQAEREGWITTLVIVIAHARSNHVRIAAFVEEQAPWAVEAPKPGELSAKVKTGLNTVIERMYDLGVREVLVQFRADLQAARDGVTLLNQYKKLHELLHNLQVKFLRELENAAEEARAGAPSSLVEVYALQLRQCAKKARARGRAVADPRARIRLGGDARSRRGPG